MGAVIDIGNSNVHVGFFEGERLRFRYVYPRHGRSFMVRLLRAIARKQVDGCAISSVVPEVTKVIFNRVYKTTGSLPILVTHRTAVDLQFKYKKPATLGADRIANVIGGLTRYRKNIIVIDCGTAVTFDCALKSGIHLGGVIIPGMQLMIDALATHTALLNRVHLQQPRRLIATSTQACLRSGVYYGAIYAIEGLVTAFKKMIRQPCMCIATGGWGKSVARHCPSIDRYDQSLTLYGALQVYLQNVG